MYDYKRVAPRDIFSEANFLFNIGLLIKSIEDEALSGITYDSNLSLSSLPFGFDDGSIESTLESNLFTIDGIPVNIRKNAYSRETFSIFCTTEDWEIYDVFDSKGNITDEFKDNVCTEKHHQSLKNESAPVLACAALMKCIGKLALHAIDETIPLRFEEQEYSQHNLSFETINEWIYPADSFLIAGNKKLSIKASLHTKSLWPAVIERRGEDDIPIFDEAGQYTTVFTSFINQV